MTLRFRNRTGNRKSRITRHPLQIESLESRQLLAVVTSLANSGAGTLREALAGSDPVITFSVSGTIDTQTQLLISRSVTVDATGQNITLNNVTAGQRVINIFNMSTVTLRNITITGGDIPDTGVTTGGAIRALNGTLTVDNCTIDGNIAREGGAIGLVGSATVNIINSTISNNTGRQAGGAIDVPANGTVNIDNSIIESNTAGLNSDQTFLAIGGGIRVFGTANITNNSILRNNMAATMTGSDLGYGGGLGVTEGGSVTIEDSEISGNMSERGGGVGARGAVVVIRNSLVSGNTSTGNGGGLRVMRIPGGDGDVTVENSVFRQNSGDGGGGIGLQPYTGSEVSAISLTVTGSTFDRNSSLFDGGAIENFGADLNIENSTFSGNSSDNDGGGIWSSFSDTFTGAVSVRFSTLTGNHALSNAGGIYSGAGPFDLHNNVISDNTVNGSYPDVFDYDSMISSAASYNVVSSAGGHSISNGTMGNLVGTPAVLGPLTDNGGPTPTHLLMAGPGVDGADPAATLGADQRGFIRPGANASRDMGAVETDGTAPTATLDFNNDTLYDCADMDLLEAAIDGGVFNATFDVNGDSTLSSADVFAWLMDAGEARFGTGRFFKNGDANLDGVVDGQDFITWNGNKFTSANRWCLGDFNQDDVVDGQDFIIWNANKFTSSDASRPGVNPLAGTTRLQSAQNSAGRLGSPRQVELAAASRQVETSRVPQAAPMALRVSSAGELGSVREVAQLSIVETTRHQTVNLSSTFSAKGKDEVRSHRAAKQVSSVDQAFADLGVSLV